MECCKRCGCKDCRFYLLKTPAGEQLVHKLDLMYDLGVRSFAIFFDDISAQNRTPRKSSECGK